MVFFNHATRQMTTKIVYYGPGLCGKTTNLNTIYTRTSQKARGEMVSLNTETDRTLFFDLLPMDVGMVGGFKTKLQLYTVPGQVFYNSTRKLVLKGVDGIVFVADSQMPMLDANKESFQNLRDNLRELGLDIRDIPIIFQWNKRDLKNIVPVDQLERELNPDGRPSFQSIASDGTGVFETLRGITKLALAHIKALHLAEAAGSKTPAPAPAPLPPPPEPQATDTAALQASDFSIPEDIRETAAPEALNTTDLGGGHDIFDEDPAPLRATTPSATNPVQVMAPMRVKLAPTLGKAMPPVPKVTLKPLLPAAAAPKIPVSTTKATHVSVPKPATARHTADLHLELSPFTMDGDMEVIVTVRQNGAEVGTCSLRQVTPAWGSSGLVSVEIRRT